MQIKYKLGMTSFQFNSTSTYIYTCIAENFPVGQRKPHCSLTVVYEGYKIRKASPFYCQKFIIQRAEGLVPTIPKCIYTLFPKVIFLKWIIYNPCLLKQSTYKYWPYQPQHNLLFKLLCLFGTLLLSSSCSSHQCALV